MVIIFKTFKQRIILIRPLNTFLRIVITLQSIIYDNYDYSIGLTLVTKVKKCFMQYHYII